jgi:glutamate/tyrosine decarboxylase-like PLP-dependent enzyme
MIAMKQTEHELYVTEGPMRIPARGRPHEAVLEELRSMKKGDARWRDGRVFALVYHGGDEHERFLEDAHGMYFSENALNPMAFKSLWRMEREVVEMSAHLFNGPKTACGTMSSGGTESLLLAVKAARDRARAKRPWIRSPEVVLPETAHVAFDKACDTYGLLPRYVPLDPEKRADVKALRRAISRNTVLVVASAPQYPHGTIDPIAEIGAIAAKRGLPFHVDACIGGFVLPFIERLGHSVVPWDFRVEGVTSISADIHKYGYGAKGASVIVYRDVSFLEHQFFVSTDWCGGVYASPTMLGTRAGGPIAAAWAALRGIGEDGYLELTRKTLAARERLLAGLARIDGLELVARPDSTLVAYTSRDPDLDIYAVGDALEERGWAVDRQQRPASIHLTLMAQHEAAIDAYLAALTEAVAAVRSDPGRKAKGHAATYGLMAKVPVRGLVKSAVRKAMADMYKPDGKLPDAGDRDEKLSRFVAPLLSGLDRLEQLKNKLTRRSR